MPPPKRPAAKELALPEDHILQVDDPRPQRVTQYPSNSAPRFVTRGPDEAVPTAIFDTEADQELQAQYGLGEPAQKPAFLYVERGPGLGQLIEVRQGAVVIGRASVADLRIQHSSVSRRHCQIKRAGEQFFVKDLGSQNGTFVNKQRIATEVEIRPGNSIALGNALVRLRGPLAKGERLPSSASRERVKTQDPAREATRDRVPVRSPRTTTGQGHRAADPQPSRSATNATATVRRPRRTNVIKLAIFAGALGFGLAAALVFALVKGITDPLPEVLGEPLLSPRTALEAAAQPLPGRDLERERLIREAIEKKLAGQRAAERAQATGGTAEPAAGPAKPPAPPAASTSPSHQAPRPAIPPPLVKPAPVRANAAAAAAPLRTTRASVQSPASEEDQAENPPETKPDASRTRLLAAYERGDAESALDAAKQAGNKPLVATLTQFLTAYDAAQEAMAANNGVRAIVNFQKALALDELLSSGWRKNGGEIRRHLSSLYSLVGLQYVTSGEGEKARRAFEAALKHDPANARARSELEKLEGGAPEADADDRDSATPMKAAPKDSIDAAFND
jgi:pSer/pThr/pTyr-binding forkhead associated (FHA) protein/tetratricopeptide (TPR) repeat protein